MKSETQKVCLPIPLHILHTEHCYLEVKLTQNEKKPDSLLIRKTHVFPTKIFKFIFVLKVFCLAVFLFCDYLKVLFKILFLTFHIKKRKKAVWNNLNISFEYKIHDFYHSLLVSDNRAQ